MAIDLILENGQFSPVANSYADEIMFAAYMDRIPDQYKANFLPSSTYQRKQYLVWSTQLLENNIIYPGHRHHETQRLSFPRIGVIDSDGFYVNETTVPQFMIDATCQLAFELMNGNLLTEPTRGINSLSVGPISIDFDTNHANDPKIIPRSVLTILLPFNCYLRGSRRIRSVPVYRA